MENLKITFPSIVEKIATLKDRTLKLTLTTQELSPEDMTILFKFSNNFVTTALASAGTKIDETDLEIIQDFPEEKSPAKRLRAVLYRLWEQGKKELDFELYYRQSMEKLINMIKEKLL